GAAEAKWANLNIDLGSDHYILATTLQVEQRKLCKFIVTDWDKFRKIRKEYVENEEKPDLERWTEQIGRDIEAATKEGSTDLPVEKMDSRLAHLIEAKPI
ncbi:hypothetical protein MTO96_023418, partial [Rhipicephalus appendiculatus]